MASNFVVVTNCVFLLVFALFCAICLAVGAADPVPSGPPNSGSNGQPFDFTPANICRLMVDKTYIVNPSNCNNYYQCNGGSPTSFSCPSGMIFNKETGTCISSAYGSCNNINTMCTGKLKGTFLADVNTCGGYYYCNGVDNAGQHGSCPNGENFSQQSQKCMYPSVFPCSKTNTMQPICSYVANGKYFGVNSNCAGWANCVNGQYQTGTCASGLFNTKIGECDQQTSEVTCTQVSLPQDPIVNHVLQGTQCNAWTTQYEADTQTCSGFYFCNSQKIALWGQCNNNKFFSNGKCVDRSTVVCNSANICENTAGRYQWVNDPLNCQKYYTCKNNVRSATSTSCAENRWFNEVQQTCTPVKPTYAACTGGVTLPPTTPDNRPKPPGPN